MIDWPGYRLPDGRPSLRRWTNGAERCSSTDTASVTLSSYGFSRVARWQRRDDRFCIFERQDDIMQQVGCVYAFVINDEIVRIGSSKGTLENRMNSWQKDVSKAFENDFFTPNGRARSTKEDEIKLWIDVLAAYQVGDVWARQGTPFKSPISETVLHAYQDEESFLIARHQPRFNRGSHR